MTRHSITLKQLKEAVDSALANNVHPTTPVAIAFDYGNGPVISERPVDGAQFVCRGGSAFCLVMAPVTYDAPSPSEDEAE